MGSAIYAEFESKVPGYDPSTEISGKGLAQAMDALGELARSLGVREPWDFYSESNEEAFEKLGEELPEDMEKDGATWFDPTEGLKSVRSLLTKLRDDPKNIEGAAFAMSDLEALRKILEIAEKHGVKFRLRIDI
jgi:hypothetical protein